VPTLLDPIRLGAVAAPNRILMAPMTRGRATRDHMPTPIMAAYYAQRASAGLILSEAVGISRQGLGWPFAPGLWSDEQVTAWQPITRAVHAAGGRIFAQLWHMGRTVHPSFLDGAPPVSASATTAPIYAHTYGGKQPYQRARALDIAEIAAIVGDYRVAAGNAIRAGFDGVELHAANGYLVDQFMRDGTNDRTDVYGGSIDKRLRLLREVIEAMVEAAGADRTALRLSPNDMAQGCDDSDPSALFRAVAQLLDGYRLAFLELRASRAATSFQPKGVRRLPTRDLAPMIREIFTGPLVLNSDYRLEDGSAALASGQADAISFGRTFIANPDLPDRLAAALPLDPDEMATWYGRGPRGYVEYRRLG